MLKVAIIIGCLLAVLTMCSMAKVAGEADRKLEELFEAFLLGEEQKNGNSSKEVSQTA